MDPQERNDSNMLIMRGINTDELRTIHQSQFFCFWIFTEVGFDRQDPRVLAVDRWLIRAEFYDDCFQASEFGCVFWLSIWCLIFQAFESAF